MESALMDTQQHPTEPRCETSSQWQSSQLRRRVGQTPAVQSSRRPGSPTPWTTSRRSQRRPPRG
eukprot:9338117-Lingulodinium_polyedra.AAC.1